MQVVLECIYLIIEFLPEEHGIHAGVYEMAR